ncbi:MAG: carbamoyltransferase C-terminal domain-containing protein, partial [Acidobacteriota bacterium]
NPREKLSRQLWAGPRAGASGDTGWLDPGAAERAIRERLGFDGQLLTFPHHLSHAASAFYFSGFADAAVLTVDGVGEWSTMTYGTGQGRQLELFEEVTFPHSLGLLYSTLTAFLGFRVNDGEYKVMGLAPYGEPRFVDQICTLVAMGEDGQIRLNLPYFDFISGSTMFSPAMSLLFGTPPRKPRADIEQIHRDIARSLQLVLEEILLEKAHYLQRRTAASQLCMAGGVALNCVANGRLRREGPFDDLFVQPAAGDSGGCLGAAALAHIELTGERIPLSPQRHAHFGPRYSRSEIAGLIRATGLPAIDYLDRESELLETTAQRLADGEIIGWFHGRMEHGPRALGARSILADPRQLERRERVNRLIKKREDFRPFAPSVLLADAGEHFELDHPSPFMLETCRVVSGLELAAVTHVDGSARPQTVDPRTHPRYAGLLSAFKDLTGCPILLNTSFNVAGEPIVCSPVDALFTFALAGLDALVLEDFVIERDMLPENWPLLLQVWDRKASHALAASQHRISETLYTFV